MKIKATLAAGAAMAASMLAAPAPAQAQSDPLLGQLMLFGGNFCPRGWADTSGQLLSISQNQALFSLLGTIYGGDGRTTFALPDLRGRAAVHDGSGPGLSPVRIGQRGGTESFTLTVSTMPSHTHTGTLGAAAANADVPNPIRNSFATSEAGNIYLDGNPDTNAMHPDTLRVNPTGGGIPVNKRSPFLTLRYCIATQGIFPSRN